MTNEKNKYKGKTSPILVKIMGIEPFGLIIQTEGYKKRGFVYEKEISDNFIPDLNLKFKIGETIYVSPFLESYTNKQGEKKQRTSYSYKDCHKVECKLDPLFSSLINNINKLN